MDMQNNKQLFQLENSGNLPKFSSPQPFTYWNAVYFLMVTMSTGNGTIWFKIRQNLKQKPETPQL